VLDWSKPLTWMLAGVAIVIAGAIVAQVGGNGEAGNPVIAVGVLFVLIGAFTAAWRRGAAKVNQRGDA